MKKKSLLFTLILMFICTGVFVNLIPDTVQAAGISDHLAAIEIFNTYNYNAPDTSNDNSYDIELCFDAEATIERISFLTPAGNSYEFDANIYEGPIEDGWLNSGRWYDPENTFNYEWCYEREFQTTPSALDDFGDGTYTVTLHYENGSSDQTTAWFGIPGTNNPIVQPTQPPTFTNFSNGDTLRSPVTFEWNACSDSAINFTYIDISNTNTGEDIGEEEYPGCTVDSFGPIALDSSDYGAELEFEIYLESVNSDGIDIGVGKGTGSEYFFTVIEDSDNDGIPNAADNCPNDFNA